MKTKNKAVEVTDKPLKEKIEDALALLGEKKEAYSNQQAEQVEGKLIWGKNVSQAKRVLAKNIPQHRETVEILLGQAVEYENHFASNLRELEELDAEIAISIKGLQKAHHSLVIHERSSESQARIRLFKETIAQQNALATITQGSTVSIANSGTLETMPETQQLDSVERNAQELLYSVQAFLELKETV